MSIPYEEALRRDKLLFEMALYDTCGGMMKNLKSEEQVKELQEKTIIRFNFLKKLVKSGEYTFDEIIEDIVNRNSANFEPEKIVNIYSDESINRMINLYEDSEFIKKESKKFENIFDVLSNLSKNKGNNDGKKTGRTDRNSRYTRKDNKFNKKDKYSDFDEYSDESDDGIDENYPTEPPF